MTTKRTRISQLKGILSLQKKRSRLLSQLANLDQQISDKLEREVSGLASESAEARSASPRPAQVVARVSKGKTASAKSNTRGPKGVLKAQILEQLAQAGAAGVTVRDLAATLQTKPANIHTWFSTNSDRIPGLRKIAAGHYALSGKTGAKSASKAAPKTAARTAAPKAAKVAKAPKAKAAKAVKATSAAKAPKAAKTAKAARTDDSFSPSKRGELKTSVLAELKKAGSEGITVTDLADKVGTRYKNLYIWFVTTGKRIPGIEKVGPARYRLNA